MYSVIVRHTASGCLGVGIVFPLQPPSHIPGGFKIVVFSWKCGAKLTDFAAALRAILGIPKKPFIADWATPADTDPVFGRIDQQDQQGDDNSDGSTGQEVLPEPICLFRDTFFSQPVSD
jgi:hypothetical protein